MTIFILWVTINPTYGIFRNAFQKCSPFCRERERESHSEVLKDDMAGIVSQTAQCAGELNDMFAGVRHQKDHSHHPVNELTNGVVDGILTIGKIRAEIRRERK